MPKSLTAVTFDDFVTNVDGTNGHRRFDLSDYEFVTPGGMVLPALAIRQACSSGTTPVLTVPNANMRSYLARAGFLKHLSDRAQIEPPHTSSEDLPFDVRRGQNPLLLEITVQTEAGDLPEIIDRVIWVLRRRMSYRKSDAFDIGIVISEIWQNAFDHTNGPVTTIAAMQVYGSPGNGRLEMAIGDDGDGVLSSLRRNPTLPRFATDTKAIRDAIKLNVSEHDDRTRGHGLALLVDKVFSHDGAVTIRSGRGKVHIRMDKGQGWAYQVPHLSGTQVVVNLPTE